jgi:hypothetical protein
MESKKRECGSCTVCCEGWLYADIYGRQMYPGVPCHFKSKCGCSIYKDRPEGCKKFSCGYLMENSPFPEWFKPDECGVLILTGSWQKGIFFALLETDRPLNIDILVWVIDYCKITNIPFAFRRNNKWRFFGSEEFNKEMQQKIKDFGRLF